MLISIESETGSLHGRQSTLADAFLPDFEQQRWRNISREDRRDSFLLGRLMLRCSLGEHLGIRPANLELELEAGGRPVLADRQWQFSISHSGGRVLLAATDTPGGGVGVDLERAGVGRDWRRLAKRRLPDALAQVVMQAPAGSAAARFCTYWTLLEAVAKARGASVLSPDNFPLTLDLVRLGSGVVPSQAGGWRWVHQVDADWHRCLVWSGEEGPPVWQRWQLP